MGILAPLFLIGSSLFLQVTRTTITSRMSSNFGQIRSGTTEKAALERLGKYTFNGRHVVANQLPSFLTRCSSFLQVSLACINAYMLE